MHESTPPIDDLLPQQGIMRLLDGVTSWTGEEIVAHAHCDAAAWYAQDDGSMPAWLGIELMAQAIAAHVNLLSRAPDRPPRRGVLLGTRGYRSDPDRFIGGAALTVRAKVVFRDDSGLGGYDCAIEQGTDTIAQATIKVFEPDDFEQFARRDAA
jgi:predicted hotdog family 3-hydroxylacyl-ACP dehydratase